MKWCSEQGIAGGGGVIGGQSCFREIVARWLRRTESERRSTPTQERGKEVAGVNYFACWCGGGRVENICSKGNGMKRSFVETTTNRSSLLLCTGRQFDHQNQTESHIGGYLHDKIEMASRNGTRVVAIITDNAHNIQAVVRGRSGIITLNCRAHSGELLVKDGRLGGEGHR